MNSPGLDQSLQMLSIFIFFFLFSPTVFLVRAENTSPAIFLTVCGKTVSKNAQGMDVNFVNAMELTFKNITKTGFGTAVFGTSNIVYGLGQCFNYLSPVDCQLCYSECRVKLPHCTPNTTGRIYVDGCFLRYADYNMSMEATDASSDTSICGNSQAVPASRSAKFNETVIRLVGNLTSDTHLEKDYYKVGSSVVSGDLTVYGMAQCWRSLNRSGCRQCMESARGSAVQCLPAAEAKALNAGCFLRYSTVPFYLVEPMKSGGSSTVKRRLVVAMASVIATLAVIGIAVIWRKMRASPDSAEDLDESGEIIRSISSSRLSFKYEELRKATDDFSQVNKLGQGGYGAVYKGVLPDGRVVAVKRLFFNTRQWIDKFFNEVNLVNQVQHKNLVKLFGCSVEGPESLLVYDYLCNKSLDYFLFDPFKRKELDWKRRFNIILGTAEGLTYLHSASEIRIIHRDVKVSNILLDESFRPKLADFGLARYFAEGQSHLSTGLAGTFGYMAPEYIVHGQLTEKADIYSYGIAVLEIITGQKNQSPVSASSYGESLAYNVWQRFNSGTLKELVDPYLQGQCTEDEAVKIFHVGLLCIQATPNLRPPMWKVVEMLNSKPEDLPPPTRPPFLNRKSSKIGYEVSEASSLLSSSSRSPFSLNELSGGSLLDGR